MDAETKLLTPEQQALRQSELSAHLHHSARLAAQRDGVSQFFLVVNGVLLSGLTVIWEFERLTDTWLLPALLILITGIGALASAQWRQRLMDYKQLLKVRYDIYEKGEAEMSWRPIAAENLRLYPPNEPPKIRSFSQYASDTARLFLVAYVVALAGSVGLSVATLADINTGLPGWFQKARPSAAKSTTLITPARSPEPRGD